MHFDEHVEGVDTEDGGGGGGGKHDASVAHAVWITVIGMRRAWSFERMDFTLLVRLRGAHRPAVQRSRWRRARVAAWHNGVVSDGAGHTTMTVGVFLQGGRDVRATGLLKTRGVSVS